MFGKMSGVSERHAARVAAERTRVGAGAARRHPRAARRRRAPVPLQPPAQPERGAAVGAAERRLERVDVAVQRQLVRVREVARAHVAHVAPAHQGGDTGGRRAAAAARDRQDLVGRASVTRHEAHRRNAGRQGAPRVPRRHAAASAAGGHEGAPHVVPRRGRVSPIPRCGRDQRRSPANRRRRRAGRGTDGRRHTRQRTGGRGYTRQLTGGGDCTRQLNCGHGYIR